jgi:ABC-type nitrate/sulfonate/bicarbonate transport system substrate-binding protein
MMSPVNVGMAKGIFQANSLDVEIINFSGSARAHQAMAAGALDLLIGGGPDLAFIVKGSPEIGVAVVSNAPDLGFIVSYDSPLKSIDDLKGKKIGISTAGSLTAWLANELALVKGWGPNGVVPVSIGSQFAGEIAAMKTGNVDAFIETNALGLQLEETKSGRLLAPVSTYVGDLVANIIFASNDIVKTHPEAVKQFVKSWFETIAFMKQHRQQAVPLVAEVTGYDLDLQNRDFDLTLPDFSSNGRFAPAALNTLAESFVQLKVLDVKPDMSKLYTEQFLPAE